MLVGLRLVQRILTGVLLVLLVLGVLVGLFGQITLADILAVADAEHHDHVIGLFLREKIARDVPPVEIAFRLVAQQPGMNLVLADDADFRRVRKRVLQSIGEPIGHAVAHHHDRGGRRRRVRIRLARARRMRGFGLILRLRLLRRVVAWIGPRVVASSSEEPPEEASLLTLAVQKGIAVIGPLGLGGQRERDVDGGHAGALRHGQNDRPDEPMRKPDFAKHADRPRL